MKLDIEEYRLARNPCQGCEAYYPNIEQYCQCQMEIDDACDWIKIYDAAVKDD